MGVSATLLQKLIALVTLLEGICISYLKGMRGWHSSEANAAAHLPQGQ